MIKKQEKQMPADNITLLQKLAESGYLGYAFVCLITFLGASVRYVKSLAKGQAIVFRDWMLELVVSAFVAVMIGLLCEAFEVDYIWSCVAIGWGAHEGTRALYLAKNAIHKRLGIKEPPEKLN